MSFKELKTIGNYTLGRTIGEGTFGLVKLGVHQLTGEQVAIKILEKEKIKEQADLERVAREINILKKLRHPHIIQLYEIVETERSLYLIMEYAKGGELFEHITHNQRLKEFEAASFLVQILSGVEYLHTLRVMHRDLKPENLLLDENHCIKIADFGLSNTYQQGQFLKTACGSPCYAAPEMIAGKEYQAKQADIWSCGVILYAMICGFLPFEDSSTPQLYRKIINGDFQVPKFMTPLAKDLLEKILNVDPVRRYSIEQIMNHFWVQSYIPSAQIIKGINLDVDTLSINYQILNQLKDYNFKIDYAQQCLLRNRHNQITTTYYLLLKKNKLSEFDQTSNQENHDKQQLEKASISNIFPTQISNQLTIPIKEQNQSEETSQQIETYREQEQESENQKDQDSEPKQEVIEDPINQEEHIKENISKENLYQYDTDIKENKVIRDISSHRVSLIEPNPKEIPKEVKTRQASMSVEKRPETLFPTVQQIKEKALQFKNRALDQQQDKSPQAKKPMVVRTNQAIRKSAVSPHIQIRMYEGPFNLHQLYYGDPALFTKRIVSQLLNLEYDIMNQRKFDFRIQKNHTQVDYSINQVVDGVYAIKCLYKEGSLEEFQKIYGIILSFK